MIDDNGNLFARQWFDLSLARYALEIYHQYKSKNDLSRQWVEDIPDVAGRDLARLIGYQIYHAKYSWLPATIAQSLSALYSKAPSRNTPETPALKSSIMHTPTQRDRLSRAKPPTLHPDRATTS